MIHLTRPVTLVLVGENGHQSELECRYSMDIPLTHQSLTHTTHDITCQTMQVHGCQCQAGPVADTGVLLTPMWSTREYTAYWMIIKKQIGWRNGADVMTFRKITHANVAQLFEGEICWNVSPEAKGRIWLTFEMNVVSFWKWVGKIVNTEDV